MGTFALDIHRFAEKAEDKADEAVRAITIAVLNKIVLRSAVGNPELWAANAEQLYRRQNYNVRVNVAWDFLSARGAKKRPRALKTLSPRTLTKKFPLHSGKGYVGGRFRGNWQVSIGNPILRPIERIDPNGAETIAAGATALAAFTTGPAIYLMNNVPYAVRLEYGHSKQAPSGVVRITAAEFQAIVNEEVSNLAK